MSKEEVEEDLYEKAKRLGFHEENDDVDKNTKRLIIEETLEQLKIGLYNTKMSGQAAAAVKADASLKGAINISETQSKTIEFYKEQLGGKDAGKT